MANINMGVEVKSCKDCKSVKPLVKHTEVREVRAKPPLGIMPREMWMQDRLNTITNAIDRYVDCDMQIPLDWVVEYNNLVDYFG